MLYKIQTATKPIKPCELNEPSKPWMFPITEMFGQNGMPCPLNRISRTMPRASNDTPTSANADDHDLIDFNISILSPITDFLYQYNYYMTQNLLLTRLIWFLTPVLVDKN